MKTKFHGEQSNMDLLLSTTYLLRDDGTYYIEVQVTTCFYGVIQMALAKQGSKSFSAQTVFLNSHDQAGIMNYSVLCLCADKPGKYNC